MTRDYLKEFDERFPQREIEGRINEDTWLASAPSPKDIKSFLAEAIAESRKEGREEVSKALKPMFRELDLLEDSNADTRDIANTSLRILKNVSHYFAELESPPEEETK